jgi:hypothetical protein
MVTPTASRTSRSRWSTPSGMDSAAARGTTPRAPAHEMTAGTCHIGRSVSMWRQCWNPASGKIQAIRTAISVAVISSIGITHGWSAAAWVRTRPGSCSPMRAKTTLSRAKTTVPCTAWICNRVAEVVSRDASAPRITLATTTAVMPEAWNPSAST